MKSKRTESGEFSLGRPIVPGTQRFWLGELMSLIGDLYESPIFTASWEHLLQQIRTNFRGSCAYLHQHNHTTNKSRMLITFERPVDFMETFQEYHATHRLHLNNQLSYGETSVHIEQHLLAGQDLDHTVFYNEWLGRKKRGYNLTGLLHQNQRSTSTSIGVTRHHNIEQFDLEQQQTLEDILPHIRRAIQFRQRLTHLEEQNNAMLNALSNLGIGVAFLDPSMKLLKTNEMASNILEQNDGLSRHSGSFSLENHTSRQELKEYISERWEEKPGRRQKDRVFRVQRPSMKRNLLIYALPTHSENPMARNDRTTALFLLDPEHHQTQFPKTIQQTYKLTSAEAIIACELMNGLLLKEIAQKRKVSIATVRHQCKQLFQKTSTNSQNELLCLLFRSTLPTPT